MNFNIFGNENTEPTTTKKGKIRFISLTVSVSVATILLGSYFAAPRAENIHISIAHASSEFSNMEPLSFSSALLKNETWTYTNVWGKTNMQFLTENELQIFYPKGSYSPGNSSVVGWAWFIYKLGKNLDNANLSYQVKFDKDFDFVKWGKLPGFCSGTCPRGWAVPGDDFSTRFMWRALGDLELYAYLPKQSQTYGKSFGRGSFRFVPDRYYTISQTLRLNTPGAPDGRMAIYVDGVLVFEENDIIYRESEWTHIDSVLFSTFFWGSDATWATPKDIHASFKDFTLYY